jgi:hypothetical protein
LWLVPPAHRDLVDHIWRRVDPVLKRYFIGVFVIVLFTSIAAYMGLGVILGIHQAVFLALMTGILELIPIVGPAAAIILAGLVAVEQATGIGAIIGYAIYATVLRRSASCWARWCLERQPDSTRPSSSSAFFAAISCLALSASSLPSRSRSRSGLF